MFTNSITPLTYATPANPTLGDTTSCIDSHSPSNLIVLCKEQTHCDGHMTKEEEDNADGGDGDVSYERGCGHSGCHTTCNMNDCLVEP